MIKRCPLERYTIPRRSGLSCLLVGMVALAGLGLASPLAAQDNTVAVPVLYAASADTVRTNLWLFEALMTDVIATVSRYLPPPPAEVELVPLGDTEAEELMLTVASRLLAERGYRLYGPFLAEATDPASQDESTSQDNGGVSPTGGDDNSASTAGAGQGTRYRLAYRVVDIELSYPDTGRRMGIWRQWVERELELTVAVELSEVASGRLLASERVTRRFGDRVPDGDFSAVDSDMYPFTTAETGESGWRRRLEEIVVLGTLAGLVAVYFANTQ